MALRGLNLLVLLAVVLILVGCTGPIDNPPPTPAVAENDAYSVTILGNRVMRIIDKELGVVCYLDRWEDTSPFCMPLRDTTYGAGR